MKLQAKFTINFILVVVTTIIVSFFLINMSVQSQFSHFIEEKNRRWEDLNASQFRLNMVPLQNPFADSISSSSASTPEQNYLHAVRDSLWLAAAIDISFAIIIAYFLSSFLLQRIYGLQSSMNQYVKDGISKPVLHDGNDEVDDLARIYNVLIQKIENEEKVRKAFFVDMSHELRTPLTSIKGYLEGLLDHVFDREKEKEIHQKTLRETDRMIHLVEEMTVLAKLESSKITLTTESVNLRTLTEEVRDMLLPELEKRLLQVEIRGDLSFEVDRYKFQQVIINVLDNAIHYAKENSLIHIEMGKEKQGMYWRIINTYEHIRPEDVPYFFERFYRGDASRAYDAKKPHLGIGLNIVQKIVEQHGARISARLEDKNIVFEILFP